MPKFSQKSRANLATCHPELRRLFEEVIKHVDCTIVEGMRSPETQAEYVRTGKSTTLESKHLAQKDGWSWAVDVMVYPIDWNDWKRNYMFAGYVRGVAKTLGIDIRCGADWNSNFDVNDQSFHDLPHFELMSGKIIDEKPEEYLPSGPSEEDIEMTLDDIENSTLDD